jgi:hypothetical protein
MALPPEYDGRFRLSVVTARGQEMAITGSRLGFLRPHRKMQAFTVQNLFSSRPALPRSAAGKVN